MSSSMLPYLTMLRDFVSGRLAGEDFERAFFARFKADNDPMSEDQFEVLDELFAAVDAFVADDELRRPRDFDEEQLRAKSRSCLQKLEELEP